MIIEQKIGNIQSTTVSRPIDWLLLEWYETNKRILHKRTENGIEISTKFLSSAPAFTEGDIIFEDANSIIAIDIIPTDALVISPKNMREMAAVCYEIGNRHLPLFFDDNKIMTPFDLPLYRIITAKGYDVAEEQKKLLHPLQTTVVAHGNAIAILSKAIVTNE